MSGPVDVLALLDSAYIGGLSPLNERVRVARATVAELIEANRVLLGEWDRQDSGNKFDPMPGKDWEAAEARFRAAVANVGCAS